MKYSKEMIEDILSLEDVIRQMQEDYAKEILEHPTATAKMLLFGGVSCISKALPKIEEKEQNGVKMSLYDIATEVLASYGITDAEKFCKEYNVKFENKKK